MRRPRLAVIGSLAFTSVVAFAGLLVGSSNSSAVQKKPSGFVANLFAQASADDYVDEASCARCHKKQHASFDPSPHKSYSDNPNAPKDKQGCQGCHGPGKAHIQHTKPDSGIYNYVISYKRLPAKEASAACLRCHQDTMSDTHWRRGGHSRADVACTDCHQIHFPGQDGLAEMEASRDPHSLRQPIYVATPTQRKLLKGEETAMCTRCHKKEANEFRNNFHHPVPEGRLACSDCHDVHPSKAAAKKIRPGKQQCVTCHADKAGPFAFEHDLQIGTDDSSCTECHRPHGSHNPKLLQLFSRGMCNKCHTDKAANHHPGRNCWQPFCHVAIHGSNSDSRFLSR